MRAVEFFEGARNRLSMMRLTVFLSFWPASYVIITNPTETMLGLYLGAYVIGYIGGKSADTFMADKQLAAASDSDTISTATASSMVVEERSTKSIGTRKRSF